MDQKKVNQSNQVKDQAATRARQSYENKKKDPHFISPQLDNEENLLVIINNVNGAEELEIAAARRRGK